MWSCKLHYFIDTVNCDLYLWKLKKRILPLLEYHFHMPPLKPHWFQQSFTSQIPIVYPNPHLLSIFLLSSMPEMVHWHWPNQTRCGFWYSWLSWSKANLHEWDTWMEVYWCSDWKQTKFKLHLRCHPCNLMYMMDCQPKTLLKHCALTWTSMILIECIYLGNGRKLSNNRTLYEHCNIDVYDVNYSWH